MIQFKKVTIHNFGSYGHAELELQNRGFCLVSGQNNYVKDNALSNGSGKSFLWSAICYALTGETINGIRTNLKNINIPESDCYVQLDFLYNNDIFSLVRYAAPRSDLKIYKNDADLSGKGVRESDRKLQELLPDLTKNLIASTIIIGQGMPNKFSSFSPSGRKELLEKLTKSDFMIEDIKLRIQTRQQELTSKLRELEDSLIVNKTKLNGHLAALEKLKKDVETAVRPDFDTLIIEQDRRLQVLRQELDAYSANAADLETDIENTNQQLIALSNEKTKISNDEFVAYTDSYTKLSNEKAILEAEISSLTNEITKLKAVLDFCPTCKQRLPHVHKPDTTEQEARLSNLNKSLKLATGSILRCSNRHKEYTDQINNAFNDEISQLTAKLSGLKNKLITTRAEQNECSARLEAERTSYDRLLYDKQHWYAFINGKQKEISALEPEIAKFTNLIAITSISKEDLDQRLTIIKKMDQLIRRDFRGYLLTNIINYIDNRAKEYCNTVFGTKELSISLNGNALDITYCGKIFDGLSGGEKQRVDLILQLAIRDLLTSYLGLSANILVLDEVTDFLDKQSCKAVMQLLEKELQTVESVFIVSHHAEELELPIDSEIKVIKNEYGISELC
jgi:DNA repair exonuclease SbcCD ATPase subunit